MEEYQRCIYNKDYIVVDPDFVEMRPKSNAELVGKVFGSFRDSLKILDYGGGDGLLAELLRGQGYSAETYDPFSKFNQVPAEKFDLITSFEVMEHVPKPRATVAEMASLLKEDGAILFSTLLQPEGFEQIGLNWWYAAPRNGHISLHSKGSLTRMFAALGMTVGSFSAGLHMAYVRVPSFAAHLKAPEPERVAVAQ
jgi:2-polyprenyl-6-hydroxyphenyl methylase/3-demethylubiquinone-9 3-methyltransferase